MPVGVSSPAEARSGVAATTIGFPVIGPIKNLPTTNADGGAGDRDLKKVRIPESQQFGGKAHAGDHALGVRYADRRELRIFAADRLKGGVTILRTRRRDLRRQAGQHREYGFGVLKSVVLALRAEAREITCAGRGFACKISWRFWDDAHQQHRQ